MKVTIEQLEKSKRELAIRFEAAKVVYEKKTAKHKAEFVAKVEKYQEKWDSLSEQYFNESLVDRMGQTVKIGDIITEDGAGFYRIKKRLLSADHKGVISFAFVVATPISKVKQKDVNISSDDLKSFDVKVGKASEV